MKCHTPWFQTTQKNYSNEEYGTSLKNKHKDQCNRTESSELNPHINGQLINGKEAKYIQWSKDNLFN